MKVYTLVYNIITMAGYPPPGSYNPAAPGMSPLFPPTPNSGGVYTLPPVPMGYTNVMRNAGVSAFIGDINHCGEAIKTNAGRWKCSIDCPDGWEQLGVQSKLHVPQIFYILN